MAFIDRYSNFRTFKKMFLKKRTLVAYSCEKGVRKYYILDFIARMNEEAYVIETIRELT